MFKLLTRMLVLAAAAGLPVFFFSASDLWSSAKNSVTSLFETEPSEEEASTTVAGSKIHLVAKPNTPPLEGVAVRDFGEIFRFDVTTGWVMSRWSRVSTGMAQLQLQGYRIPLVTGTARNDLAGALTYYFGPEQRVRKITFNGTTGDATRLVQLVTSRYGLRRRPANDSGLFIYEAPDAEGDVQSLLRIRPTGIVKADQPYQRFHVDLVLVPPATVASK